MDKKIDLPENAKLCIIELAAKYGIAKVVLFGSRARGSNRPQSDIDIAVAGGDTDGFTAAAKDTDEEDIMSIIDRVFDMYIPAFEVFCDTMIEKAK